MGWLVHSWRLSWAALVSEIRGWWWSLRLVWVVRRLSRSMLACAAAGDRLARAMCMTSAALNDLAVAQRRFLNGQD